MAKKKNSKKEVDNHKHGKYSFSVSKIIANINKKTFEANEERIEKRVATMVNSLAKREAETAHYKGRTERMLAGLNAVKNVAQLERWFEKGF